MGIEPTKIGYFLARVGLPICGDAFSLKSFFAAFSPFFFFPFRHQKLKRRFAFEI